MGRPVKPANIGNVSFGAAPVSEERWESRVIDIDILYYGDRIVDKPNLQIPHRGAADRKFELEGMCDLQPDFVHPVLKKSMQNLLNGA
ncbi:hypothetical protein HOK22_04900, partial [Candidatus Peregrinibacteria bacterium]|nr:hypothetical protein [Candidatus Peregrinibacteria bacterium]